MKFLKSMGKCVAIALVFGLVAGAAFTGVDRLWDTLSPKTETADASNETGVEADTVSSEESSSHIDSTTTGNVSTTTDVSEMVENVMPSIVAITNVSEQEYRSFFTQGTQVYESTSCGSGIIVGQDDSYLYIATNNHVVSDATSLTVEFSDGTTASAETKGTEEDVDLAVVQVALTELTDDTKSTIRVATLGDSDDLVVGQAAVAIGNALGYGQSVTTGVISALDRPVSVTNETTGTTSTNNVIQTDAAINPGNSGGALLNLNGEVIGINSSKYSSTSVEGMGFALPINEAKKYISAIMNDTLDELEASKGYLGINGIDVSSQISQSYNMPVGVYIASVVENTAASEAGLKQGQIITAVDGTEVTSVSELSELISKYTEGDEAILTVMTNNGSEYTESEVTVTLGGRGDMEESTETESSENSDGSQDQNGQNGQNGQNSQNGGNSFDLDLFPQMGR
jgi:serine protease Do